MFEMCKDKNYVAADRETVQKLMISFNEPMVAPSSHSAQPAHAYICTLKEGKEFAVYIYLYLTIEKVGILYRYTDRITDNGSCQAAEEEALQFTEAMGFIVDDASFNYLEISEQNKLLASIPMFIPPPKAVAEERPSREEVVEEVVAAVETVTEKGEEEPGPAEEKVEEKWEPELFLSKFRMRAAAERMKKEG